MAELAGSFEQYGAWRDALAQVIVQLRRTARTSRRVRPFVGRISSQRIDAAE
jgi:hypothetical protein